MGFGFFNRSFSIIGSDAIDGLPCFAGQCLHVCLPRKEREPSLLVQPLN